MQPIHHACRLRMLIPSALSGAAGPVRQVKGVCGPSRGEGDGMRSEQMAIAMAMVLPG